jgi:phosphatidylinositol glycan class M
LAPNEWLHPSFGKYLFAACDILNGVLIYRLLVSTILPKTTSTDPKIERNPGVKNEGGNSEPKTTDHKERLAVVYAAVHLFNPLVFAISTRGSSESVVGSLVLMTLYYALNARWDAAAVFLGISTHWKIYPLIYGVACLGVVGRNDPSDAIEDEKDEQTGWKGWIAIIVNGKTVRFVTLSAGTFLALGIMCYLV